jgi:hypothetical protein
MNFEIHFNKHRKRVLKKFFVSITFILLSNFGQGQNEQIFDINADWVCPPGVTSVNVECWGGGGGGGSSLNAAQGGSGGGGGAYVKSTGIAVIPNTSYTVRVGNSGGGGGWVTTSGSSGGDSWFISSSTIRASGGTGGNAHMGSAGIGGSSNTSIGQIKISGNNGEVGTSTFGGAGGKAGGEKGGAGASRRTNDGNGFFGGIPGGGGGGAFRPASGSFNRSGGSGASGRVIISWEGAAPPVISSFFPTIACKGGTIQINGMYFTGATSVKINGISANFVVNDDISITATIPLQAASGIIEIVTPTGIAQSQQTLLINDISVTNGPSVSSQFVCKGEQVSFSIQANSSFGSVQYKWYKEGLQLHDGVDGYSSVSTQNLHIEYSQLLHTGNYTCMVSNNDCQIESSPVSLLVRSITNQPVHYYTQPGTSAFFSVNSNIQPNEYQWQISKDGGNEWTNILEEGSNPTFSGYNTSMLGLGLNGTNDIVPENNGYQFRCLLVYNNYPCSLISSNATLYLPTEIHENSEYFLHIWSDNGSVFIQHNLTNQDKTHIEILDINGKVITKTTDTRYRISLPPGIYIVKLHKSTILYMIKKIVVQ